MTPIIKEIEILKLKTALTQSQLSLLENYVESSLNVVAAHGSAMLQSDLQQLNSQWVYTFNRNLDEFNSKLALLENVVVESSEGEHW